MQERLESEDRQIIAREGEIWWCALGTNVGVEIDGKHLNFERPVVIARVFNREAVLALPITSKHKSGRYYYSFSHRDRIQTIVLSQVRAISTKRLLRRVTRLPDTKLKEINDQLVRDVLRRAA